MMGQKYVAIFTIFNLKGSVFALSTSHELIRLINQTGFSIKNIELNKSG